MKPMCLEPRTYSSNTTVYHITLHASLILVNEINYMITFSPLYSCGKVTNSNFDPLSQLHLVSFNCIKNIFKKWQLSIFNHYCINHTYNETSLMMILSKTSIILIENIYFFEPIINFMV